MTEPVQVGEYQRRTSDAFGRCSGVGGVSQATAFGSRVVSMVAAAIGNSIRIAGAQKLLYAFAMSCIGARCIIVGEKGILAQSLVMAAVTVGCPELIAATFLGSIAGLASRSTTLYELPRFLAFTALLHLVLAVWKRICKREVAGQPGPLTGAAFVCSFGVRIIPSLVNGDGVTALPVSLAVAGLAVSIGILTWRGLTAVLQALDRDIGIASLINPRSKEAKYILATIVVIIGGLDAISIGSVYLSHVLAATVVMVAALCYGSATGSFIGGIAGMGASIAQVRYLPVAIAYFVSGIAVGLVRSRNVVVALVLGTAAGAAACTAICELLRGSLVQVSMCLAIGAGLAYAAYTWIPELSAVSAETDCSAAAEVMASQVRNARERLKSLAGVFCNISQIMTAADEERGYSKNTGFDLLLQEMHRRVCSTCGTSGRCWDRMFYATYETFLTLFADLEVRSLDSNCDRRRYEVPAYLHKRCINSRRVVKAAVDILEEKREQLHANVSAVDTHNVISSQFRGLAEVVDRMVEEICQSEQHSFGLQSHRGHGKPVEAGIYRAARSISAVSGDSRLVYDLGNGRTLIVLGDGMGIGEKAASESRFATTLVKELIVAGMSHRAAIETVNSIMLIRRRDESFTTLDMAIIDTRRKKVEFTKMGSWPSYLKRGRTVERISSSALPIGILPSVEFETIVRTIHKGDYVVMASDGVLGCSSDMDVVDRWILQYLKSTSITCPRELVNALADDMRAELNVIWDDDVTLIAVKVP